MSDPAALATTLRRLGRARCRCGRRLGRRYRRWARPDLEAEELDLEDQGRVRGDDISAGVRVLLAGRPVGERGRDDELALAPDLQPGTALHPTGNDLARTRVQVNREWRATVAAGRHP